MIHQLRVVGAGLAAATLLAAGALHAQDSTPARSSTRLDAPAAKRTFDPARRVPVFFGQIGLTPEQREAIYKIRGKHQAKVEELERQIAEIQAEMLSECEGVLSDTQKQMLAQRRKTSAAGRKAEEPLKSAKGQAKAGG